MPLRFARQAAAAVVVCLPLAGAAACSASHPHPVAKPSPATASPAGGVNIYTLLPFSRAGLTAAVTSATHASVDYQTFKYTDTPAAYGARIAPWVTPGFDQALQDTFGNQITTAARARAHETSTATAEVASIATFGPTSITFIVTIQQHDPVTDSSGNYRVTATTTDGRQWFTDDIQPATAGNP